MKRWAVGILAALIMWPVTGFAAEGIEPVYPMYTSNRNVWSVFQQYQNMIEEIEKSVTKGTLGTLPQDAARWLSYIDAMRSYITYWQAQTYIDYPVTHGREYEMGDPLAPDCVFKDNIYVCDLLSLVVSARDELVVSGSADIPMHLLPADLARQEQYWSSMEGFITDFMSVVTPLDEPVTSAEERLGLQPGFDKQQQ